MATEVDICNLALSLIGVGPISALSSSGSEQTMQCNRWYAACRDATLEDFKWNFATKRLLLTALREIEFDAGAGVEPSVGDTITSAGAETAVIVYVYLVTGTFAGEDAEGKFVISDLSGTFEDDEAITWGTGETAGSAVVDEPNDMGESDYTDWDYSYAYPSDCIKALELIDEANPSLTGDKVPFEVAAHGSLAFKLILTNQEDAELKYTAQVTTTTMFSQLFIDCLARKLAATLVKPLRKDIKLESSLTNEYITLLGPSKTANANEGHKSPNNISSYQEARS